MLNTPSICGLYITYIAIYIHSTYSYTVSMCMVIPNVHYCFRIQQHTLLWQTLLFNLFPLLPCAPSGSCKADNIITVFLSRELVLTHRHSMNYKTNLPTCSLCFVINLLCNTRYPICLPDTSRSFWKYIHTHSHTCVHVISLIPRQRHRERGFKGLDKLSFKPGFQSS